MFYLSPTPTPHVNNFGHILAELCTGGVRGKQEIYHGPTASYSLLCMVTVCLDCRRATNGLAEETAFWVWLQIQVIFQFVHCLTFGCCHCPFLFVCVFQFSMRICVILQVNKNVTKDLNIHFSFMEENSVSNKSIYLFLNI